MKIRSLLLVLLMSMAAACSREPSLGSAITAEQRADAQAAMRLTFPQETRWLLYHRESGGPDDAIFLKIDLPPAALGEFLAQPRLTGGEWRTESSLMASAPHWPEWQPHSASRFRYAEFELPNAEHLRVLVVDDVEEPKVVYLFWHET